MTDVDPKVLIEESTATVYERVLLSLNNKEERREMIAALKIQHAVIGRLITEYEERLSNEY